MRSPHHQVKKPALSARALELLRALGPEVVGMSHLELGKRLPEPMLNAQVARTLVALADRRLVELGPGDRFKQLTAEGEIREGVVISLRGFFGEVAREIVASRVRPVVRELACIFLHSPSLSAFGECECPDCGRRCQHLHVDAQGSEAVGQCQDCGRTVDLVEWRRRVARWGSS